jgi:hypothetical protein
MSAHALPWLIVTALSLILVAGALIVRRMRARDASRLSETVSAHERALADQRVEHEDVAAKRAREHYAAIEAERSRVEALQLRLAQRPSWERKSLHDLMKACESLGVDAVIATNVVFLHEASGKTPFVTEIDHVVLTERGCLIIEGKNWSGAVVDGVPFNDSQPVLKSIVQQSRERGAPTLTPPFAVHISPRRTQEKHLGQLSVRIHPHDQSPVQQVRSQSRRLAALLASRKIDSPFFTTGVYYSNSAATVTHAPTFERDGSTTYVMSTPSELERVLRLLLKPGRNAVSRGDIERISEVFRGLHADMCTVGSAGNHG